MKDAHIFFIFVFAILLGSCALMVYYRAEGFALAPNMPRIVKKPLMKPASTGRPKVLLPIKR